MVSDGHTQFLLLVKYFCTVRNIHLYGKEKVEKKSDTWKGRWILFYTLPAHLSIHFHKYNPRRRRKIFEDFKTLSLPILLFFPLFPSFHSIQFNFLLTTEFEWSDRQTWCLRVDVRHEGVRHVNAGKSESRTISKFSSCWQHSWKDEKIWMNIN